MSASAIELDIRIEDTGWDHLGADCTTAIQSAIAAAATRLELTGVAADVLLTCDAEMRRLNAQWRNIDKATDVLSFEAGETPSPGPVRFLGDIALGLETCARDADKLGREMSRHVSHLAIHGLLHLLGYNHMDPAEAAVMEGLEVSILGELGYPDPYLLTGTNSKPVSAR